MCTRHGLAEDSEATEDGKAKEEVMLVASPTTTTRPGDAPWAWRPPVWPDSGTWPYQDHPDGDRPDGVHPDGGRVDARRNRRSQGRRNQGRLGRSVPADDGREDDGREQARRAVQTSMDTRQ